jgi:hypothetical protein
MRQPHSVRSFLRYLVLLVAPIMVIGAFARAYADDRSEARTHYQAGVKAYSSGDYRGAIREFSAAQQLAPADLNNYNLALCYDKLGDAEPAIQYYRTFLEKQPSSDKRAEVEASVSRLEAAVKSAASKKDDARNADEARAADKPSEPPPAEAPPVSGPPVPGPSSEAAPPDASAPAPRKHQGPAIAGSIGTPSTASPVPTGDSQLDRVSSINIDEIRDQRVGGSGSGLADRRGGPAVAANDGAGAGPPAPGAAAGPSTATAPNPGAPATLNGAGAPVTPGPADQPKKETPLYKKWWFWGVVAVSAYVVYELATSDSKPQRQIGFQPPQQPTGLTLLRW